MLHWRRADDDRTRDGQWHVDGHRGGGIISRASTRFQPRKNWVERRTENHLAKLRAAIHFTITVGIGIAGGVFLKIYPLRGPFCGFQMGRFVASFFCKNSLRHEDEPQS